jgi:hypothetical protein
MAVSPCADNNTDAPRSKPPPSITCRVLAHAPEEGPNIAEVIEVGPGGRVLNAFSLRRPTATALHSKPVGALVELVGTVFETGGVAYMYVSMVLHPGGATVIPFRRRA